MKMMFAIGMNSMMTSQPLFPRAWQIFTHIMMPNDQVDKRDQKENDHPDRHFGHLKQGNELDNGNPDQDAGVHAAFLTNAFGTKTVKHIKCQSDDEGQTEPVLNPWLHPRCTCIIIHNRILFAAFLLGKTVNHPIHCGFSAITTHKSKNI